MNDPITVIWTPVPGGLRAGDAAPVVSVLVSPRLRTLDGAPTTLAAFEPFIDWPATLRSLPLAVSLSDVGQPLPASLADPPAASSELWSALFPADGTAVRSHTPDDFSDHAIITYPSVTARNALRGFYADYAATRAVQPLDRNTFAADLPELYPDLVSAISQAVDFHAARPPAGDPPPDRPEDLLDFHAIVSALGDHLPVLRALGLLFDVVLAPDTPGSELPRLVGLVPQFRPSDVCPLVQVELNAGGFFALSRQPTLPLRDGGHDLVELDVDGSLLKLDSLRAAVSPDPPAPDAPTAVTLPALRGGGLAITLHGRGEALVSKLSDQQQHEQQLDDGQTPILDASQLERGYVIDVDDGEQWRSLCRRRGSYQFAGAPQLDLAVADTEGWVQLAVTGHAGRDGGPPALRLHESLARWDGWSLVAPRPGNTMSAAADTAVPPTNDPLTSAGVAVTWEVEAGTLPTLRFGRGYRMRARIVDLAGHVVSLTEADESEALPADGPLRYGRFEPVPAPVTVLRAPLDPDSGAGESSDRLVLRTQNTDPSLDAAPGVAGGDRQLVPPRTSVQMAELHGALDDAEGRPRADLYALLCARDAAHLGTDPSGQVALEPAERLVVPYLPDPLARGVALRDLPGTTEGTVGRPDADGALAWAALPGAAVRPGSATLLPFTFDGGWPAAVGLRLAVADGHGPPRWDPDERLLTVELPKGSLTKVRVSSLLAPGDLELMAIWQWLRDWLEGPGISGSETLPHIAGSLAQSVQLALEGGHWMLTPPRELVLVSAVRQPIGEPTFTSLVAERTLDSTQTGFVGELAVHGASTSRIELLAEWTEQVVDHNDGQPPVLGVPFSGSVDELILPEPPPPGSTVPLLSSGRYVGDWDAEANTITFGEGQPRHQLHDTRHRLVSYRARAATRFREYFPAGDTGDFTRTGASIEVDVPASARPPAPAVLYALPAFGWERQEATSLRASRRLGGGLRIYLGRPWFSSGDDERLAVVTSSGSMTDEERASAGPYLTQWGRDPIAGGWRIGGDPRAADFPGAQIVSGLPLAEMSDDATVDVATYNVEFAPERDAWWCDIELPPAASHRPFIRLTLARYQPHAISGAELSPVVGLEWVQPAPERSTIITYDPERPDRVHVTVTGSTYPGASPGDDPGSRVELMVQERSQPWLPDELAWVELTNYDFGQPQTGTGSDLLWRGSFELPANPGRGPFRLVVRELEDWPSDTGTGQRTAYLDVLALPGPSFTPAEPEVELVDWTGASDGGATGQLHGQPVVVTGQMGRGNYLDGSFPLFATDAYSPPLPGSDAVNIVGLQGNRFTVTFGAPVQDPFLYLASLGSTIAFPPGTELRRISGDTAFAVLGWSVSNWPHASPDANGLIRVMGRLTSLTFTTTMNFVGGSEQDGIYLQIAGSRPGSERAEGAADHLRANTRR